MNNNSPYQLFFQPIVIVPNDELVKVLAKELENNNDMLSKYYEILNANYVRGIVRVILFYVSEDLNLCKGLLLEFSFVFYNLYRHMLLIFMIKNPNDLPIGALTNFIDYLISECNMIVHLIHILMTTFKMTIYF